MEVERWVLGGSWEVLSLEWDRCDLLLDLEFYLRWHKSELCLSIWGTGVAGFAT